MNRESGCIYLQQWKPPPLVVTLRILREGLDIRLPGASPGGGTGGLDPQSREKGGSGGPVRRQEEGGAKSVQEGKGGAQITNFSRASRE